MRFPALCLMCHRGTYDLAKVEVTARYTDCSVWKAPCCGRTTDDRYKGETYREITQQELRELERRAAYDHTHKIRDRESAQEYMNEVFGREPW